MLINEFNKLSNEEKSCRSLEFLYAIFTELSSLDLTECPIQFLRISGTHVFKHMLNTKNENAYRWGIM